MVIFPGNHSKPVNRSNQLLCLDGVLQEKQMISQSEKEYFQGTLKRPKGLSPTERA